jgi:NAD(P)-dependent dehydrogenase (short-subunit alcohol dehydrogenase family)
MGVAVVTGASRGLGKGLVEAFAAAGHEVHGFSRSSGVDVTDAAAVERFAASVAPIDLWVNNAGVLGPIGPLVDADPAEVARHLDVNVLGVVHGIQAFLRHRSRGGVLVNITSGAATKPYEGWGPYCASKAAVDMLTEIAAREAGIRAYAVAPGVVDTDMQAEIRATPAERFPAVERFHDLKRRGAFNSPAWVARHLLDLAFGDVRPPGVRWRIPDEDV